MRLSIEEVQKQHENTKKLYEQGLTVAPVDVKRVLDLYDTIEALQKENEQFRAQIGEVEDKGKISDGYHTFDELYYHRMILFSVICNHHKDIAWKSWKHADGTMFDNYFIVGITTPKGDYSYHYHKQYWDIFDVKELEFAPEWDGHQPKDIDRLLLIIPNVDYHNLIEINFSDSKPTSAQMVYLEFLMDALGYMESDLNINLNTATKKEISELIYDLRDELYG